MIQLPWWAVVTVLGVIFWLAVLVTRLTDKVRVLRRIIRSLEGIEEEEFQDTDSGGAEGRG